MKIIDLTHSFMGKMPVYPGDPDKISYGRFPGKSHCENSAMKLFRTYEEVSQSK